MAESIRGINVVIGADTTGLSKALSDVNKRSKDIQSELKQVERLLKLDPSNTELLAQKQKLLADAIENAREKLDRLRSVQEQVNEQFQRGEISEGQYRAFQRETEKTRLELEKLEKQLKDMEPAVESFGEKMQKAGDKLKSAGEKMTDAGKKLSIGVTAPIVGLGTVAGKAAVEFESAFAGVRKTVDATEEQFAQLEQGIRDMSKRMPASATDIAAVAEAAGQLGIETDNILKFTETMIGLGEATNLTAEEGATQFARFANIVGMNQKDFDRLGSTVVALGNNFATTEAEIVNMGMRLAGQGAQIGLTEAQIMALAAAMSSVGIEAEAGGTAMSTVLKRMQTAVSLAGEDLDKFASIARMSAEDFARAFQSDPAAAIQAFIDGLAASSAAGENLTVILSDLGITGIRESDTLLRLAGANDTLHDALSTATEAWEENVALQKEVEQRYSTSESQFQMFQNKLQDIAITLGEALIPALMDMLDAAKPIVDMLADAARWFADLDEGTQKVIIGIVGFAAALGPILMVLGPIVSGIGGLVSGIGALLPLAGGAAGATSGLGGALAALTGPVGLTIAAIAGLVAGLIALYNKNEDFRKFVDEAWVKIKDKINGAVKAIRDFVEPYIRDMVKFVKGQLDEWRKFWEKNGEQILSIVKRVWDQIKANIDLALGIIKGLFEMVWPIIEGIVKVTWESIKLIISNVTDVIRGIIEFFLAVLRGDWDAAWQAVKDTVKNIWGNVETFLRNINLKEIGKNIVQGFIDGIGSMVGALRDRVKGIADTVSGGLKDLLKIKSPSRVLMQLGEYTGEGFVRGLERSIDAVRREAAEMAAAVTGGLGGLSTPGVAAAGGGVGAARVTNVSMEGLFAGANFYVRSDSDIQAIARELYRLQQGAMRGAGLA
jgi:TP901 family phage tail tape measure protein